MPTNPRRAPALEERSLIRPAVRRILVKSQQFKLAENLPQIEFQTAPNATKEANRLFMAVC
jgi:hypothetical protein